jgi:hypothetical protein
VIHETALRTSLAKFQGRPLIDWKKSFILDPVFRNATRPSVIGINLDKFVLKPTWVKSRYLHADPISVQSNEKVFEKYLAVWREKYMKVEHPKSWVDKRESSNKHVLLAGIPMKELISFLIDLNVPESRDVSTMLLVELCALNALDRKPDLVADVVLINDLDQSKLQSRILGPTEPLDNIFIGRNPQGASLKSLTYVGDEKIYTENTTVHLRFAKILNPEDNKVSFVPWISIRPSVEISTAIVEEKE